MIPNVSQIISKPLIFPNSGKGLVCDTFSGNRFSTIVPNIFQMNPVIFTNFGMNLFFPVDVATVVHVGLVSPQFVQVLLKDTGGIFFSPSTTGHM